MYGLSLASIPFLGPRTLDRQIAAMFRRAEGVWYDPSDFERYMGPLGPDLIVNGGFNSGASWVIGNVAWTISGGVAANDGTNIVGAGLTQAGVFVSGKSYELIFDMTRNAGNLNLWVAGTQLIQAAINTGGSKRFIINAAVSGSMFFEAAPGFIGTIDNISVRELTAISTATMFQDAAGTIPVTAVEQPVGLILDKSGNGNNASQTVSTKRPVLKQSAGVYFLQFDGVDDALVTPSIDFGAVHSSAPLGAELVVNGDFSAGTDGWTSLLGGTISVTGGVATVSSSASLANTVGTQINTVPGRVYLVLVDVTSLSAGSQSVLVGTAIAGSDLHVNYSTAVGRRSAFFTATTTTTYVSWGCGSSSRSAVIDNISVKEVPAAYVPDKLTVVAGVRKLSDAAAGTVAELSADTGSNNGSFFLRAPRGTAQTDISPSSRGTIAVQISTNAPAPGRYVSAVGISLAPSKLRLRVNGADNVALSSMGTGTYGNYPLYIGSRAGTSLPFNGNLHQLAIFGATLTAAELAIVERYVGRKTGVTL